MFGKSILPHSDSNNCVQFLVFTGAPDAVSIPLQGLKSTGNTAVIQHPTQL